MDTGPGAPADTDQAEDDIEIERPERGDSAEDDKPRKQDKGSSDTSDGRREEFTR
jgi:hypothetical protein